MVPAQLSPARPSILSLDTLMMVMMDPMILSRTNEHPHPSINFILGAILLIRRSTTLPMVRGAFRDQRLGPSVCSG